MLVILASCYNDEAISGVSKEKRAATVLFLFISHPFIYRLNSVSG